MISEQKFNIYVENIALQDNPATIVINLRIGKETFFSKITYESIPSWQSIWDKYSHKNDFSEYILGAIVIWECMRFLALGGEEIFLCDGLKVTQKMKDTWQYCFLNQYAEWRYLNKFHYSNSDFPRINSNSIQFDPLKDQSNNLNNKKKPTTG